MGIATLALLFLLPACQGVDEEPKHDHVYELPFMGKARPVTQASDGKTHKGTLHVRFRTSDPDAEYLERGRRYRNPKK